MPAEFYTKVLYPLQEKVLTVFQGLPFYLTGGTALSRGYYQHRFSTPDIPAIQKFLQNIAITLVEGVE